MVKNIIIPPKIEIPIQPKPKIIKAKVTAYTYTGNPTSCGNIPSRGGCAVDNTRIPYGTVFVIPDYGVAIANDTGSAMRKYDGIHIDVFMETKEEANQWGVKYLEVEVKQ